MIKKKIELEYPISTSAKIIYSRLSTASGLSEWFADDVTVQNNIYTFTWDGSDQEAELIQKKANTNARFKWVDDEDEESFFEFKLSKHELTGDLALLITDYVDEDEVDDAIELWNKQIDELKHTLGI